MTNVIFQIVFNHCAEWSLIARQITDKTALLTSGSAYDKAPKNLINAKNVISMITAFMKECCNNGKNSIGHVMLMARRLEWSNSLQILLYTIACRAILEFIHELERDNPDLLEEFRQQYIEMESEQDDGGEIGFDQFVMMSFLMIEIRKIGQDDDEEAQSWMMVIIASVESMA
ncbi:MAG: hypothetical protein KBD00_03860 [Candidatus Peribacteraceae bacterium]|nr:hypothetical protein [Candidatus Peribacteraceae bacterium]